MSKFMFLKWKPSIIILIPISHIDTYWDNYACRDNYGNSTYAFQLNIKSTGVGIYQVFWK